MEQSEGLVARASVQPAGSRLQAVKLPARPAPVPLARPRPGPCSTRTAAAS